MAGGKCMCKEERNDVTVKLPYEVGAIVITYQNGQRFIDRVRQYVISDKINVILDINCEENNQMPPIELEEFKKRWEAEGRRQPMVIELPYEVDTPVKNGELSGRIFSYTVSNDKTTVIVHLKKEGRAKLSEPIELEEFKRNWNKA
ncbi:MAG: hypothetical protein HFJ42_08280 [Clostridia bacterium]|nr:hypothetical protein [Clostridia bacterium]